MRRSLYLLGVGTAAVAGTSAAATSHVAIGRIWVPDTRWDYGAMECSAEPG